MTDRSRSLALLLADGLRFTAGSLTEDQYEDIIDGLMLIAQGKVTDEAEKEMFQRVLNHGWITTAPFNPSDWSERRREV